MMKVPEVEIKVKAYKCYRCGHVWQPRSKNVVPETCANCKSPYWNRPRKIKK